MTVTRIPLYAAAGALLAAAAITPLAASAGTRQPQTGYTRSQLPPWLHTQPVPAAVRHELHIRGPAVEVVGETSVIITRSGQIFES